MQPIRVGNFNYTQNEKGEWIYKSIDVKPLLHKKEKAKYKERPRFKLQEKIEDNSKQTARKIFANSAKEIARFLKNKLK